MRGNFLVQKKLDKVLEVIEIIKQRLQASAHRQNYTKNQRRPLEFDVGDNVFLKMALMRGVMKFGKKGKVSLRYIGPFEVIE